MDALLRLMDRRLLLGGALLLMTLWFADYLKSNYSVQIRSRFAAPPEAPDTRLAAPLQAANEAKERARLGALYRRVLAELEVAETEGFDVTAQRDAAAKVFALIDSPKYRDAAIERLNKLRVAIPRKGEGVRAHSGDPDMPPPAPAPRVRTRRR